MDATISVSADEGAAAQEKLNSDQLDTVQRGIQIIGSAALASMGGEDKLVVETPAKSPEAPAAADVGPDGLVAPVAGSFALMSWRQPIGSARWLIMGMVMTRMGTSAGCVQ